SVGGNRFGIPGVGGNAVGVYVLGGAGGVQIGGNDLQFENVFDNSLLAAIFLGNTNGDNLVLNNIIGVAPNGYSPAPHGYGIFISGSPLNTVRGNYIGNTTYDAIYIGGAGAYFNVLQQNYLGWDFFGEMPNGRYGVNIDGASSNIVGNGSLYSFNF